MIKKLKVDNEKYNNCYTFLLKNKIYILKLLELAKYGSMKDKISRLYKSNWDYIIEELDNIHIILNNLNKNKNISGTLIKDLINIYMKYNKKLRNKKTFLNYLLKIMDRPNFLLEIEQLLYLLSSKERVNIYNKNIDRRKKLTKPFLKEIVENLSGNIDLMKEFILIKPINIHWGNSKYEYIRKIFETLSILNDKYKNPLSIFKIKINCTTKITNENIDNILLNYVYNYRKNDFNNKIDNIGTLLLFFRKRLTLWEAVDMIFNELFPKIYYII